SRRSGGRRRRCRIIRHQRELVDVVEVAADPVTPDKLPDQVVLFPIEQAGLDIAADVEAVAGVCPVDKQPVLDLQGRTYDGAEIEMPPRLRDVPGGGEVRPWRLERIGDGAEGTGRTGQAGHRATGQRRILRGRIRGDQTRTGDETLGFGSLRR